MLELLKFIISPILSLYLTRTLLSSKWQISISSSLLFPCPKAFENSENDFFVII